MPRQRHRRKGLDTAVPDGSTGEYLELPEEHQDRSASPGIPPRRNPGDEQQPSCLFKYSNDYLTYRMWGVRSGQRTQEQEGLHGCR